MNVCLYHDTTGGKDIRDVIREYEWYYKGRSRRLLKFHVLITTYDDLIKVCTSSYQFSLVILICYIHVYCSTYSVYFSYICINPHYLTILGLRGAG